MKECILAESKNYSISHEYEVVYLTIKRSQVKFIIGDFYGEPDYAYISTTEEYCVVGGCGLIIYYLREPYEEYRYKKTSKQYKEFMRYPPSIWWIDEVIPTKSEELILVTTNQDERYQLNINTLECKKVEAQ